MPKEIWKTIAGYNARYQVSSFGRVRRGSYVCIAKGKKLCAHPRLIPGGLSKITTVRGGYQQVGLGPAANCCIRAVHQLVLETFIGPAPVGKEACHKDGNPSNNKLRNLRWGTHASNMRDKKRHGTDNAGERHGKHVLTDALVRVIRDSHKHGETYACLAKRLGVHIQCIGDVCRGKTWKHIPLH